MTIYRNTYWPSRRVGLPAARGAARGPRLSGLQRPTMTRVVEFRNSRRHKTPRRDRQTPLAAAGNCAISPAREASGRRWCRWRPTGREVAAGCGRDHPGAKRGRKIRRRIAFGREAPTRGRARARESGGPGLPGSCRMGCAIRHQRLDASPAFLIEDRSACSRIVACAKCKPYVCVLPPQDAGMPWSTAWSRNRIRRLP